MTTTAIRPHQRIPQIDSWEPGTLTPPDPPREEEGDFAQCAECPAEIDTATDEHVTITTWDGRKVRVCKHCAEMVGLL
jgi:hypothetical protein